MRAVIRTAAPLLAAALVACAHAPAPAPETASAAQGTGAATARTAPEVAIFFPLAVGNQWTWVDRSPRAGSGEPKERTVRILSRDAEGFYVDDANGALKVAHGCVQDRVRRILCAPLEADRTWTSIVSETSTERYQVAATGVTARVPAGEFTGCVLVRARNRAGPDAEVLLETTYAPGVGPVRIETFALVDGKKVPQVKAELRSYRIERTAR
jgi:hypothetical protein